METKPIRDLTAEEIECRISYINDKFLTLLLYKTARVDSAILDETFGKMNWKCRFEEVKGNMYCGISVYDDDKKEWVEKMDCGVESFSEKQKGEASDAFKRAGFKWGIGVELYSAPFIYIPLISPNHERNYTEESTMDNKTGKTRWSTKTKFYVEKIEITNHKITGLSIKAKDKNVGDKRVFVYVTDKKEEDNGKS